MRRGEVFLRMPLFTIVALTAMYFEDLLKLTEGVDSDRAELEEAREFIRQKES